jgi:Ca2+-binding RTX toxin-like protein
MDEPLPIIEQAGTRSNDLLLGSDAAQDWIAGNLGDDTIYGHAGDDKLNGNRGNDIIFGGLGNDKVIGGAGDDDLYGEDGNDRISGDQGNDRMTGGAGRDTFIFINKFHSDTITDFNPEDDTIQFARKSFQSFAAVQAAWQQDGDDVLIHAPGGNVLRIENVLIESLTAADFLFA